MSTTPPTAPLYKRVRSTSASEEAVVQSFIDSCADVQSRVSCHPAAGVTIATLASHVLLLGTAEQLNNADALKPLPFYNEAAAKAISEATADKVYATSLTVGHRSIRFFVGIVNPKASRYNSPLRPDTITTLVSAALADGSRTETLDIFSRFTEELCVATAVAKSTNQTFSAKGSKQDTGFTKVPPAVRIFFPGPLHTAAATLKSIADNIHLASRLIDAPTNLVDTTTLPEIIAGYAAKYGFSFQIIAGEDLREQGYGGIYNVGKAAEYPPALVVLRYSPKTKAAADPKVALVGKGIVYDTGGLAIKPKTGMLTMKVDMGGAATVFSAFLSAVQTEAQVELACLLCLADNAVGPKSYRNGDIVRLKCGISLEITNTDAEGRVVLSDGVFHASALLDFVPDTIIDAATLTGAVSTTCGKHHAGLFTNSMHWEGAVFNAGLSTGDLVMPMLFAPEFHAEHVPSKIADKKNADNTSPTSSVAAYVIYESLSPKYNGSFVHLDIAGVADRQGIATGYGVALLYTLVNIAGTVPTLSSPAAAPAAHL